MPPGPGVWEDIKRYKSECRNSNVRQDVMNGKKYQELFSKGWLKEEDDFVTFLVNTDGVLLYTSSGIHLWSIYIALNEIPPEKR